MTDDNKQPAASDLSASAGSRFVLEAKMGSHRHEAIALMDWIEKHRSSRFLQQVVAQVQDRYFIHENNKSSRDADSK